MKRKIFAIMLAVMMVVSILPTGVFADDVVAMIGDTSYTSLATAISDASNGAVIKVLKDTVLENFYYDANKSFTIEGTEGGVTITITPPTENPDWIAFCAYENNSIITLGKNLTINSTGAVLSAYPGCKGVVNGATINSNAPYNIVSAKSGGVIEIEEGSVINGTCSTNKATVASLSNGNIKINGGTITSVNSSAVAVTKGGNLEVNGGTIFNTSEQYVAVYTNNGKITVNGGKIYNTEGCDGLTAHTANGIIVVNGGDINNVRAHEGGIMTINGGTIRGYVNEYDTNSNIVVNGGIFTTDVTNLLASGKKQILVADLGKATKRGHDFIGWSIDGGNNILSPDDYVIGVTPVAVFEANELGNTEILPRLYPLTVIAGEGGTIEGFSGEKDLAIAFGAGRKIDIVPDEYHVVKNVVVNGKYNLGAVESYEIVSAHMAYSVEVEFEDKIVTEKTAVYTEDFSGETKWVSGGTAEAVVAGEGTISVKSTGGDPNINMPEAFGLACDSIDEIVVKYTNNTENTSFQIFFTNEANPGYSEAGSFKGTCAAGENEMVIKTEGNELWTGTLSNMRIDLSNGEGEFIVDEITFNTVETMTAREAAELAAEAETVAAE